MKIDKKFLTGVLVGIIIVLSTNLIVRTFTDDNGQRKLAEIQRVIDENFSGEIDKEKLKDYMYIGYVSGLEDRYSYYMNKETFEEFIKQSEGSYVGIGVSTKIDKKDNKIKIVSIFEGSNASSAGIQIGDKIIKVSGTPVDQSNYTEAVSAIRGGEDTKVKLTILRENENKIFETEVIRKNIDIPTVNGKLLENEIGYIKINE